MTEQELNKRIQEWRDKLPSLLCPMAGVPCTKQECRFYVPWVSGNIIGPNLPPLLNLEWACIFEQMFDMVRQTASRNQGGLPVPRPPGAGGQRIIRPGQAN